MPWELLLVIREDPLVALLEVGLRVASEGREVGAPAGGQVEGDATCHDDGGGEVARVILLEGIVLEGQVAEEFSVLLNVLGDLGDEGTGLPRVTVISAALREVVADEVQGADSAEGPVQVAEDLV